MSTGFRSIPGDFCHFRKCTGESGFDKIFSHSVHLHVKEGSSKRSSWHLSDTTVQENSTAFPTDARLCRKVTDGCKRIADVSGVQLRRSYSRESRQPVRDTYNGRHPGRVRQAKKARKRLQTIANTRIRDLDRKID